MRTKIYIENQLIDLFNDEDIVINSSVADTEQIEKVNSDWTQTFTVPASDNNNRIFRHYYNADIDNTFDARTKKDARIEIDGLPFRSGKIRLHKVSVANHVPENYTLIFWGPLVNFKDLVKNDELQDLDLSIYDHSYSYGFVRNGLTTGLFDNDIIYTLLSQKRQYMYNSNAGNDTDTEKLVNIAFNGADRGVNWSDLKPSIRVLSILEAIETKYNISFSRDFFGRTEFKELYMWLNNSDESAYTSQLIDWTTGNATAFGLNLDTNEWVRQEGGDINNVKYRLTITPQPGYEGVPYRIIAVTDTGQTVLQEDATGTYVTDFIDEPERPFVLRFYVAAAASFQYKPDILMRGYFQGGYVDRSATGDVDFVADVFEVTKALPKMKIIDFMRGLFNMFKMVFIPDGTGYIYANTLDDYYRSGKVYDITECVDFSKYEVYRAELANPITFKYQEPTTILNQQYKKNNNIGYGDAVTTILEQPYDGQPLDGQPLDIQLPFEQVVYERLLDLETNQKTNIQYGLITDDKLEPASPKALLYYNNRVNLGSYTISLLNGTGNAVELSGTINTPAHTLGLDTPLASVLWNVFMSTWNGANITKTLFSSYWENYVNTLYNIKRRTFLFKAVLPVALSTGLKFNDVLYIKERYYRISSIRMGVLSGLAELKLFNTFENNFGLFRPAQDKVTLSALAQSYGVYVSNGATLNTSKTDTGFGTDWATLSQEGFNLIITVTENATSSIRDMYLNVDNGEGRSFQIYLTQNP